MREIANLDYELKIPQAFFSGRKRNLPNIQNGIILAVTPEE